MTDRIRTITVTLTDDHRTDDAETIIQAIRMIKSVATVEPGPVVTHHDHLAREDYRRELGYIIAELATGHNQDFLTTTRNNYTALKQQRGY